MAKVTKKIAQPAYTGPPVVFAVVGSDAFLQLEAVARITKSLPAGVDRRDMDGDSATLADVLDEVRCFAMFGGAKLVVVRNADSFVTRHRQGLEDYASAPSDSATLVLRLETLPSNTRLYKLIAKTGQIESCDAPKDVTSWITTRAKTPHGLSIAPDAARLLGELIGPDLGRLDNELAKLALSSDTGKITANEVHLAVPFQRERQMWDLTNALGSGNPAEAVRRWRQLQQMDSSAEYRAVTWLGIWLENVVKALQMLRDGRDAFTIGNALRIWPRDLQQPFIATVKALGNHGAARALHALAKIDYQTKTGVGDASRSVERFLLTVF